PATGQRWDDWLMQRARDSRQALLAHRDAARVTAGNRPTDAVLPWIEEELDALCEAGFSPGFALQSVINLGTFVAGFVLEEQEERRRYEEDPDAGARDRELMARMAAGYPRILAAFAEIRVWNSDRAFEHGVRLMVDGMRAALDRSDAA